MYESSHQPFRNAADEALHTRSPACLMATFSTDHLFVCLLSEQFSPSPLDALISRGLPVGIEAQYWLWSLESTGVLQRGGHTAACSF